VPLKEGDEEFTLFVVYKPQQKPDSPSETERSGSGSSSYYKQTGDAQTVFGMGNTLHSGAALQ
jgi:hypothetical protein